MSISSLVLELWQFSFIWDWPEIRKSEISPSEFCPISRDWGELLIPNLARMFLVKCYWMLQNAWVKWILKYESKFTWKSQGIYIVEPNIDVAVFKFVQICFIRINGFHLLSSPRNYRWQTAIAFDIAIEEKIIDRKFFPSIIYLQFAMNLSLFCWIRSFFSYKCLPF